MSNTERIYEIDQIRGTRQELPERLGSHRFEKAGQTVGSQYDLLGQWFSAQDIHALLSMRVLMSNLYVGGEHGRQIPLMLARITAQDGSADNPADEVLRRSRTPTVGALEFGFDQSCCGLAQVGAANPSRGVRTKRPCVTARATLAPSAPSREAPLPHGLAPSRCATSKLKEDPPKRDFSKGRAWRSR